MAIDLKSLDLSGTAASSTTQTHKTATTPTTTPSRRTEDATQQSAGGSEVRITSTASLLSRVQQTLGGAAPFDQKRVDAIKTAISNGTYTVNPEKIANGLIDSERSLGKLKSS